jgi:membrane-bound lytic murein transglycosylase B
MVDVSPTEPGHGLPVASEPRAVSSRSVALVVVLALVLLGGLGFLAVRAGSAATRPALVTEQVPVVQPAPALTRTEPLSRGSVGRVPFGVDEAWAVRTATRAGIPVPAIRAYGSAVLVLGRQQPGCHLAWNTLAGIGWVESQHGTIGGRRLTRTGYSSTPVIGPALDGKGFAAVPTTPDSTSRHGDPDWDHAVGPMQFIGSTWERWGADADGDGDADPLDIYDAALTTARYLCADDHDLSTASGWSAAVHSYNHDDTYVVNVLNAANTYAQRTG